MEKLFGMVIFNNIAYFCILKAINFMAYVKKIPVDLDCRLRLKPFRPSEIHKMLPEAAPRVLDMGRLK